MPYKNLHYNDINRLFDGVCINKAKDSIRIMTGFSAHGRNTSYSWDYFKLDKDGKIIKCPRGLTGEFKGAVIHDLEQFPPMIVFGNEV